MKIVVVNNIYPFTSGGAEKMAETMVTALTDLGHEVFVIAAKSHFAKTKDTDKIFYIKSWYADLGQLPKFIRLIWHWFDARSYRAAKKLIAIKQSHGCDLLITHNLQGLGLSMGRVAKERGIKWIHIVHDVQLLYPSGLMTYGREDILTKPAARHYQTLVKKYFGQPDLAVSPSQWIMALHQKFGFFSHSRTLSLPNPYPIKIWPTHAPTAVCRFVYLGKITEPKGIILLLDAFREFCRQPRLKAELVVAGNGELLELVKINYQTLPIKFLGLIDTEQIMTLFTNATCLIVPSLCYENWPTVIIEAALAGLPVLASAIGGNQEMAREEYLFTPEVGDLTAKLLWLAANQSSATAPTLPDLLTPTDYVKKLLQLI